MTQITIKGREYSVEGPSPRYGNYYLTSVKQGTPYVTVEAYTDAPGILKVVGGRRLPQELRIKGEYVRLVVDGGQLREATREDISAAARAFKAAASDPDDHGEALARIHPAVD